MSGLLLFAAIQRICTLGSFVPTCDISMLFNRLASLRGQDPVRADLCEEPAAQLAGKLLAGNCGRSAAADEAK
jgi:hypothetical protein